MINTNMHHKNISSTKTEAANVNITLFVGELVNILSIALNWPEILILLIQQH